MPSAHWPPGRVPCSATVPSSLPTPPTPQLPNLDEHPFIPSPHPSILPPGPCPALPLPAALSARPLGVSQMLFASQTCSPHGSDSVSQHRSEHILILSETLDSTLSDSRCLRVQIPQKRPFHGGVSAHL